MARMNQAVSVNVLIVTTDASYIASQHDNWDTAIENATAKLKDEWYAKRLTPQSPVFMKDTCDPHGQLEQHTLGELQREHERRVAAVVAEAESALMAGRKNREVIAGLLAEYKGQAVTVDDLQVAYDRDGVWAVQYMGTEQYLFDLSLLARGRTAMINEGIEEVEFTHWPPVQRS